MLAACEPDYTRPQLGKSLQRLHDPLPESPSSCHRTTRCFGLACSPYSENSSRQGHSASAEKSLRRLRTKDRPDHLLRSNFPSSCIPQFHARSIFRVVGLSLARLHERKAFRPPPDRRPHLQASSSPFPLPFLSQRFDGAIAHFKTACGSAASTYRSNERFRSVPARHRP